MESAGDPDVEENPDVWDLFRHYDKLYFRGALVNAALTVEWTSPRMKTISGFGSCSFGKMSKTITLYQPLLQDRTPADLKNALLHLMIHAIIFVKHGMTCLSKHGPVFRDWMDAINACSIEDYLRPKRGYCITTTHDFSREKLCSIQGNLWTCESCGGTLVRATRLGPPSDSCCLENVSEHATCGNMLCYWHNHKMNCGGTYVVPGRQGQKMVPKGYAVGCRLGLLSETSEISKSQGDVQESDSDEVQENSTVAKPYAEGKLLSQVGGRNAKSPGSSSSKKASKSYMPEDFQKAIVPATPRRKLKPKQEFVASEKQELFSMVSCNNAKSLGRCSSKKAEDFLRKLKRKQSSVASEKHEFVSLGSCNNAKSSRSDTSRKVDKWHEPEHVQKSSVQPSAPQKKLKVEQNLAVIEKYGVFSLGNYNNAKPSGSSMSRKAGKLYKPESVEKSSVPLAAPPEKPNLEQDLVDKHGDTKLHKPEGIQNASVLPAVPPTKLKQSLLASEKNELSSFMGRSNVNVLDNISSKKAQKQHAHEETRKPIVRPAAPQSILKQQNKTNSSTKARKQHNLEDFRKTFVQPAVSRSKLKQSCRVTLERPKTRSKTSSFPKKKEYACVSVWANIYESECSSGSAEPLVNKRTERRKRERERSVQLTYLRSRKRIASGISSIKAKPNEEEVSSQQIKPPSIIVIDAAGQAVTQDPRDQSQEPAPRMDIVGVPPADQVKTQTPRGQTQPSAQCLDIVVPLADLMTTRAHGDPSVPSTCMDIPAVPNAVMTRAPVDQSKPPAPCSIATDQVVPPHPADPPSLTPSNPISSPDIIDISDDD